MTNQTKALLALIGAAVTGGGIAVFGKIGLKVIPPFTFTWLRFVLAVIFLLPILKQQKQKIDKNIIKPILMSLLLTANVTLFAFGIPFTTATTAQLLYSIAPVLVALISLIILKDKMNLKKLGGIFIGLIGVIIIILGNHFIIGDLKGNLIIMAAVIFFSFYTVMSKTYQGKYSPIFLTIIFAITTVIVLLIPAIKEYLIRPEWIGQLNLLAILSVIYVGFFGGAVYYLLFQYAIKHGSPIVASLTMFLQPAATYLWAVLLLGEKLTFAVAIGGLLAIGGAYITTKARA